MIKTQALYDEYYKEHLVEVKFLFYDRNVDIPYDDKNRKMMKQFPLSKEKDSMEMCVKALKACCERLPLVLQQLGIKHFIPCTIPDIRMAKDSLEICFMHDKNIYTYCYKSFDDEDIIYKPVGITMDDINDLYHFYLLDDWDNELTYWSQ
jgi:hypothetical protein